MRILVVSSYFPPEICPGAFRMGELCRGLAEAGNEVTVLTCNPRYPRDFSFPRLASRHRVYEWNKVRVEEFLIPGAKENAISQALEEFRFYVGGLRMGRKLVRPDIVIATSPFFSAACLGLRMAERWGCPFIYDMRDLYPDILRFQRLPISPLIHLYLRGWANRLYKSARFVVVNQPSLLATMSKSVDGLRLRMLMNPVILPEMPTLRAPKNKSCFSVGYAGRWGRGYDFPTLLSTIRRVSPSRFTFHLIGSGYWKDEVRRFAEENPSIVNVHYGWLGQKELAERYASWDIAILPVEPRWCVSLWPAKLPELIAYGILVIIPRELSLPPALADSRLILRAEEPTAEGYEKALEEATIRIASLNEDDYALARETVRREFSPERLTEGYLKVIAEALASPSAKGVEG